MAMQNLRDKLLKAGLVDKKQKQQVDTTQRREQKQKGHDKLAEEELARQCAHAARLAAEAEEQRQREAQRAQERAQKEQYNRVRNIADRWAVRHSRPGQRRFYFVQRSGRISHLLVNDALCDQLLVGALAIVERLEPEEIAALSTGQRSPHPRPRSQLAALLRDRRAPAAVPTIETHVLVPPEATERILTIDATAVRFWARTAQPLGFLPDYAK